MIARVSLSMARAVSSLYSRSCVIPAALEEEGLLAAAEGHRAELSDIPYCVTMSRAISVARSRSLWAPVEISP